MPTEPFRETRGTAPAWDQSGPGAASRGRRLGKNARRDIRWAMQQQPRDHVRHVELHGVRISYFNQGAGGGLESSASNRRAVPPPQTPPREPSSDPPLNSRQKRSRERARRYYASKAAAAPQEQPAAPMHLEQAPAAFSADAPSTTTGTAEQIAARNERAMAMFLERRDGGPK